MRNIFCQLFCLGTIYCSLTTARVLQTRDVTNATGSDALLQNVTESVNPGSIGSPINPDQRPKYTLKVQDALGTKTAPLNFAFWLLLQWVSRVWRDGPASSPSGRERLCMPDDSLCLELNFFESIASLTEAWLILEAFAENAKANGNDQTQWTMKAYSYSRSNIRPSSVVATVQWTPPYGEHQAGQTVPTTYAPAMSGILDSDGDLQESNATDLTAMNPASNFTDLQPSFSSSNLTDLERKGTTDTVVRVTWYANRDPTLSSISWHINDVLRNEIWTHSKDTKLIDTGHKGDTSYVGPEHGSSILSFEVDWSQTARDATWGQMEEAMKKLWDMVDGNARGGFQARVGTRNGRSVDFWAYVWIRTVEPVSGTGGNNGTIVATS